MHLVTGGAGYFGSLLVDRLHRMGEQVRVLDISEDHDLPDDVEVVHADIRDQSAVKKACQGISRVHHNVALVPLAKDRSAFWAVNRDGTRHLLQAAIDAGVEKVLYTSSSAVYGVPESNPVDEAQVPVPREDYGRAKLAAEALCWEFAGHGLDVTVIRPRTIMGLGRLGIIQILFEWIRQGRNIPVFNNGGNVYQFVHADDLADACIKAAASPGQAVYNVGAESYGTMRETLQGVVDHAETGSKIVSVPMSPAVALMKVTSALGLSPLGPYHSLMYGRSMYFDITKAKDELEWAPEFSNVEMFCQSYDWYVTNREEVFRRRGASQHRSPAKQGILRLVSWLL